MSMTVREMKRILDGMVEAGTGEAEFKVKIIGANETLAISVDSAQIWKSAEEYLYPMFYGSIDA